jgi:hypothetical protein
MYICSFIYTNILYRLNIIIYYTLDCRIMWICRVGCAIAMAVGFLPRRLGFNPSAVHGGFVVDKMTLGQVFL